MAPLSQMIVSELLSHELFDQLQRFAIGRIAELEIEPERTLEHAFMVRKCVEAVFAAVTAHATVTNAS